MYYIKHNGTNKLMTKGMRRSVAKKVAQFFADSPNFWGEVFCHHYGRDHSLTRITVATIENGRVLTWDGRNWLS